MDINTPFKIEFLTIKTNNFKEKKKLIKRELKKYPEKRFNNFYSNRDSNKLSGALLKIFKEEFDQISQHHGRILNFYSSWSASYDKGDYHIAHNHGSVGYAGIIYLDMHKKSPVTSYLQPWNNDQDRSMIYEPPAQEGDIVIVPQYIVHFTRPNPVSFKKRIISFDFKL